MTIQEAYKKFNETPELKKAAIEALKAGKGDEFLKENGFDLTVGQINDFFTKLKSGELSRKELNMAAGGCGSDGGADPTPTSEDPFGDEIRRKHEEDCEYKKDHYGL